MEQEKTIYYHVGLEKTGSTFLQNNVFPYFKGVTYLPKKNYKHFLNHSPDYPAGNYLVTHELNVNFKKETRLFRQQVEGRVYPVIFLRKQKDWLVSQYKRYLKNGHTSTIFHFFDPENPNSSELNADALDFFDKVVHLEKTFGVQPKIIFYRNFKEDAKSVVEDLAVYMSATIDINRINFRPQHTAYSVRQLKFYLWLTGKLNYHPIKRKKWFRYPMLHLAKVVPAVVFSNVDWITDEYLRKIDERYANDWEKCVSYTQKRREIEV